METTAILRTVAIASGFATASLFLPEVAGALRHARAVQLADAATVSDSTNSLARLLRNGIPVASDIVRALSHISWVAPFFQEACWLARSRGFDTDEYRCGGIVLAVAVAAMPIGWAASSSAVFGLMLSACLIGGLVIYARQRHDRYMEDVRESVPDALRTMSACFRSGYSLLQTFRHLAAETKEPLRSVFQRAASDLEMGRTVSDTLRRMRDDSTLSEFSFLTAALEIQHQTGGSMQAIIDSACESIEGELALRRSLRVQTAQARLSMRVVTIMPFVLMAVFSLVSPGFLAPFFSSGMGIAVFCMAMGMQLLGIVAVRRMLNVREA